MPGHDVCPDCGGRLRELGEDVAEMLEYVRASFKVLRHVWPKLTCDDCAFKAFRSDAGEELVLNNNVFVERFLIQAEKQHLSSTDEAEYRRPYLNVEEDRRPTLTWPRQISLDGAPEDVTANILLSPSGLGTRQYPSLAPPWSPRLDSYHL